MHCCPMPKAEGNSASGHPQHLVGDSFDCCTERYEIVVYCCSTCHIPSKSDKTFSVLNMTPLEAIIIDHHDIF